MVSRDEAVAFVRAKSSDELLAIRENLERYTQRRDLPADLLADTFYFKGIVESELSLRKLGPRTALADLVGQAELRRPSERGE